jgi:hypothetical protein
MSVLSLNIARTKKYYAHIALTSLLDLREPLNNAHNRQDAKTPRPPSRSVLNNKEKTWRSWRLGGLT